MLYPLQQAVDHAARHHVQHVLTRADSCASSVRHLGISVDVSCWRYRRQDVGTGCILHFNDVASSRYCVTLPVNASASQHSGIVGAATSYAAYAIAPACSSRTYTTLTTRDRKDWESRYAPIHQLQLYHTCTGGRPPITRSSSPSPRSTSSLSRRRSRYQAPQPPSTPPVH